MSSWAGFQSRAGPVFLFDVLVLRFWSLEDDDEVFNVRRLSGCFSFYNHDDTFHGSTASLLFSLLQVYCN